MQLRLLFAFRVNEMWLGTKVGNYSPFDCPMQQFWNREKTKNAMATKKERMRDLNSQ